MIINKHLKKAATTKSYMCAIKFQARDSPADDRLETRPQMHLRQEEPDLPTPPVAGQVPHLELKGRLTPSPRPRRLLTADRIVSFIDDGSGGKVAFELKKLHSHWVQTPVEWRGAFGMMQPVKCSRVQKKRGGYSGGKHADW